MGTGSTLKLDFNSDLKTTDTINIVGALSLTGTVDLVFTDLDDTPPLDFNESLTLITYGTAWNPTHLFTYAGNVINNNSQIVIGTQIFTFKYDGGVGNNKVTITNNSDVPPSDIILSNNTVLENEPVGTAVGSISGFDSNPGQTATLAFAFAAGLGDDDNAIFTLDGTTLKITQVFDREVKSSYSIRLRATDTTSPVGLIFEKVIIIQVGNVNETPTITALSSDTAVEDSVLGPYAFTISDPETALNDLSITATSSDETLVPISGISFGGTGANRTVTITPALSQIGSSLITVKLSDGDIEVTSPFTVTYTAVNDVPVFTAGPNLSIPLTVTAPQSLPAWAAGIDDADPEVVQSLTFNVNVTTGAAIFSSLPTLDTSGKLDFTLTGVGGSATVEVSLTDDNTASGAALTSPVQTFTITQEASDVSSLSAFSLSTGTLSPAFSAAELNYTADVSNLDSTITVTPTGNAFATLSVSVNGGAFAPVTSGSPSPALPLVVGPNTIQVKVLAQDGVTETIYTLVADRAESPNANLASLATSNGTLAPVFSPAQLGYTVNVPSTVTSLRVIPTVQEPNATIKVNTIAVASGVASGARRAIRRMRR
jgi:hypothetical protein